MAAASLLLAAQVAFPQAAPSPALATGEPNGHITRPSGPTKTRLDTVTRLEIYGFAQGDAIGDFKTNDPDWFDANRPSKLPAFQNEFGRDGHTWFSARQSRFGVKATIPTSSSDIKVVFEWDLYGVDVDAGQTTLHPLLIYGRWGDFGGGQLDSPFMDGDLFPNILDYWGPNGMIFFRNIQVFWRPVERDNGTRVTLAFERPGASGDLGIVANRIELQNIDARFPAPDISGEYRRGAKWGYAKLAAIVRWIRWDDVLPNDGFDLSGGTTGWGISLSSGVNASRRDLIHFGVVYGAAVENYFNDAPVDVRAQTNPGNPTRPVTGEALKDFGLVAFVDHRWDSHFSTALGYSRVDIDNSDLQAGTAFRSGQYALMNLLWTPLPNVVAGGEVQYAHRHDKDGVFDADDFRLQFSVRYSFSQKFNAPGRAVSRTQD